MKIEVNISKKYFFGIFATILAVVGLIVAYAANPYTNNNLNPGHGGDKVWVDVNGQEMTLQDAVDQNKIGTKTCPSGFVVVNSRYCIEGNERPVEQWYAANVVCNDLGGRLCNKGEWHYACNKTSSLGLLNMTNNWEWTDDKDDIGDTYHDTYATSGSGSCTAFQYDGVAIFNRYRCCFDR